MMLALLARLARLWLLKWELWVATRYRRARFRLSCRLHDVELVLGRNVHFHHEVRVWGQGGGKLVVEDDVWFAFYGGSRGLGPIHLQLRAPHAELRIGRGVWLMPATQILCFERITIGAGALFGFGCTMIDSDVHDFRPQLGEQPGKCAPIKIGERARLLPEVTILKGVSVGDYAVIGNKSVVQSSMPARCVAAGNPARVFLQYKDPAAAPTAAPAAATPAAKVPA